MSKVGTTLATWGGMDNTTTTWDYEGYRNTIVGAGRDLADLISEFRIESEVSP